MHVSASDMHLCLCGLKMQTTCAAMSTALCAANCKCGGLGSIVSMNIILINFHSVTLADVIISISQQNLSGVSRGGGYALPIDCLYV